MPNTYAFEEALEGPLLILSNWSCFSYCRRTPRSLRGIVLLVIDQGRGISVTNLRLRAVNLELNGRGRPKGTRTVGRRRVVTVGAERGFRRFAGRGSSSLVSEVSFGYLQWRVSPLISVRVLVPPLLSPFPRLGLAVRCWAGWSRGTRSSSLVKYGGACRGSESLTAWDGPQTVLGSRGREETLFETCSVSDMFLNFFQTRILFNQLLTFKLREYRPHISCDDILAIAVALNKRLQTQFCIGHQRITGKDLDKSLRLFVNVELLGVVGSRSIEHPKPHQTSAVKPGTNRRSG
ncbi:hypothetical protein BJ875DRAFT_444017 [Amylocarpus encephaloides]|uniref:Uncharacterized protein n=1 Tax=Amylocarpus encephaloides TaxID=45428 RepID=A0A9P8C403_9HELO|nr:hypothetical protein BJ875DRAFT_444017 [Amylocarpus encephaloides]